MRYWWQWIIHGYRACDVGAISDVDGQVQLAMFVELSEMEEATQNFGDEHYSFLD
jgi:hypothetical protein